MPQSFRLLLAAALVTALIPASRPALLTAQGNATQVVPPGAYQGLRWPILQIFDEVSSADGQTIDVMSSAASVASTGGAGR